MAIAAAVLVVFALGATLQRVAGLGLGLVAAPILSLLLGPVVGVTLSNVGAVAGALLIWGAMRRSVDWSRFWHVAPLLVVGSVIGAAVVRAADPAVLNVVLGGSVLAALGASWLLRRQAAVGGRGAGWGAGVIGGFMNTTAGVAGPAMTVYALATRWDHRSFAATLQPLFLCANATSVVTKLAVGTGIPPGSVPWTVWPAVVAGVAAGVLAGGLLARRVPQHRGRAVAVSVALTGGAVVLVRGLTTL